MSIKPKRIRASQAQFDAFSDAGKKIVQIGDGKITAIKKGGKPPTDVDVSDAHRPKKIDAEAKPLSDKQWEAEKYAFQPE